MPTPWTTLVISVSLQAFGGDFFSPEAIAVGIALIVGIDRVMSEGRALTNAIGNTVATIVIARWQGELDEERFHEALHEPDTVEAEPQLGLEEPARRRRGARQPAPVPT